MAAPFEDLNIGPADGKNHFTLQTAPTGGVDTVNYTQAQIAAGLDVAPYFTSVAAGTQFSARADAPKTSGGAGARSELREAMPDGSNITFNPFDGGDHWMEGTSIVTAHPSTGPSINGIGIVMAQLHNGNRDRATFRTQIVDGTSNPMRLRYRFNGSSVTDGATGTEVLPSMQPADILNVELSWKIHCHSGTGTDCVTDFYFNGTLWSSKTGILDEANPEGWYFKAGCYNNFDETNVSATAFGTVVIKPGTLKHWHTGWPEPGSSGGTAPGVGGGPVQFRSASSANQSSGTSMTVPKPAGVVSGDLLVAIQAQDADGTSVNDLTASGWTQLGAQAGGTSGSRSPWAKVWRKIAGASEPASYTFGDSDNSNHAAVITSFVAGTFDPTNPIAAGPTFQTSQGQANSTSHVAPSVTGVAGGMLLTGHCADTSGTAGAYSPAPGMTEQQDTAASWVGIEASTLALTAAGATGTKTATNTRSSGRNCVALVINPPPAVVSAPPPQRIRRIRHLLVR